MITINKNFKNFAITCTAIKMGNDWNISIYGGDIPHIGALALGIPRPSLKDKNKISSSVSILTITGHKEDDIVKKIAELCSSAWNSTVVVTCGIHIDNLTLNDITQLNSLIDDLAQELITKIII
ncbi:MAG: hypothetical protein IJO26_00250 [Clostridium sp.]|nr:hypothetical protein [Clostridium sp.]